MTTQTTESKVKEICSRLGDVLIDWEGYDNEAALRLALLRLHAELFEAIS